MKKIAYILTVLLAVSVFLTGCDQPRHHRRHVHNSNQNQVVHVYKSHQTDDSWLYWYVIRDGNHYYYSSSTSLLDANGYNNLAWQTMESSSPNIQFSGAQATEEVGTQTISESQLGGQFESEITANETADFASEAASSDMSSDSGFSDSSSSSGDSGGGFSGGDSGGGGGGDGGGGGGGE